MRIAIVGTSHIAALKQAQSLLAPSQAAHELIFFGAPGGEFAHIYAEHGVLKGSEKIRESLLQTSGGSHSELDPGDFGAVVLHGIDLKLAALVESIGRRGKASRLPYSEAFLEAGIAEWFRATRIHALAAAMSRDRGANVFLSPVPYPAGDPAGDIAVEQQPAFKILRQRVDEIVAALARAEGFHFIPQPNITFDQYYTGRAYTAGSVRLRGGLQRVHPQSDLTHMNADYGSLVLAAILAAADSMQAKAA